MKCCYTNYDWLDWISLRVLLQSVVSSWIEVGQNEDAEELSENCIL